jgi:hypothetical protein
VRVRLLYIEGCPHWRTAKQRLEEVLAEAPESPPVELVAVTSAEEAERVRFRGSPTILVDDRDPFARDSDPVGLTCRLYETPEGPSGSPTAEQLRTRLGLA